MCIFIINVGKPNSNYDGSVLICNLVQSCKCIIHFLMGTMMFFKMLRKSLGLKLIWEPYRGHRMWILP